MKFYQAIIGLVLLMALPITAWADNKQIVKGSGFSFTLPDHSWKVPDRSDPQVSIDLINNELQSRIKLAIRNYESPLSVLDKDMIALSTDQGTTMPNTTSLVSNEPLVINGINYYRLDIVIHRPENNTDIEIVDWITVRNKRSYQFCCGGPVDAGSSRTIPLAKVCGDIASTLKVK